MALKGKAGPRPMDADEARRNAKATAEAFHTGRVEAQFEKVTLRLASEDKKTAALRFGLALDKELAERLPGPVLSNFTHLRKTDAQASDVDIDAGAIPAQNWKIYELPERGAVKWEFDAVAPEKIRLEKDKKAGTVSLHFTLNMDLTGDVWKFAQQFGNTVYFEFEEAQMTLDEQAGKAKAAGAEG